MVLNEIGRLVVKIAGRDAGKKAVIVDTVGKNYVLIDGETRRRKCNLAHLEPLGKILKIEKNASHEDVVKAFKELKIDIETSKPREKKPRPRKKRKVKKKEEKPEAEKKPVKKEEPKKVEEAK